jgi:hypothetical protein
MDIGNSVCSINYEFKKIKITAAEMNNAKMKMLLKIFRIKNYELKTIKIMNKRCGAKRQQ